MVNIETSDKQERTCNDNDHYNQHFFSVSTYWKTCQSHTSVSVKYISTLRLNPTIRVLANMFLEKAQIIQHRL